MDVFWLIVAAVVCGGLAWFGLRIEPHWVSRDGQRFVCSSQLLTAHGDPLSRWLETRVAITGDRRLEVVQKQLLRRRRSTWSVAAESPEPPRGRSVFLLQGIDDRSQVMTLRLPARSRAVASLRELLIR